MQGTDHSYREEEGSKLNHLRSVAPVSELARWMPPLHIFRHAPKGQHATSDSIQSSRVARCGGLGQRGGDDYIRPATHPDILASCTRALPSVRGHFLFRRVLPFYTFKISSAMPFVGRRSTDVCPLEVLIVGCGFAGLACAIECTRKGLKATVLEKHGPADILGMFFDYY